jgi:predicted metal-dependent hydrolase
MKPEPVRYHYDDGVSRFDYTVHLKPRLRHRYIRIRNGEAVVTAALRTPIQTLEVFVADKAAWIARHLHESSQAESYDLTHPDAKLYWRGIACDVIIDHGTPERLDIQESRACFTLDHPPEHTHMLSMLHQYYKYNAPDVILPKVEQWSGVMNLYPTRVSFRRARTRWGSCSSHNALSLNTHLLMLPDRLIDYVIVHELGHIRHKNHTKMFWGFVEKYLPDWKERRKQIRIYEKFLL